MERTIVLALVGYLPYLAIALVLLGAFALVYERRMGFRNASESTNGAMGLSRGGAYAGYVIAIAGSLIQGGESSGYINEFGYMALDGLIAGAALLGASFILDWAVLRKIDNAEVIRGGNLQVAFVEACAYVGLGTIVCASFSGGSPTVLVGILSSLLFCVLGPLTLAVIYIGYCTGWGIAGKGNVDHKVAQGDWPAAINAGLLLLAMSLTLFFSISGPFESTSNDLMSYLSAGLNDVASYVLAAVGAVMAVSLWRILVSATLPLILRRNLDELSKALAVGLSSLGFGLLMGLVTFV